ncbi:unnamed protein product [Meganyctiphanes norvegica]|uniref:Uncharacterized protein n=1 Tax=Meganyctiphanes norvegica TaxID=48144 RepID=A0AAV2R0Z4_MEGNR
MLQQAEVVDLVHWETSQTWVLLLSLLVMDLTNSLLPLNTDLGKVLLVAKEDLQKGAKQAKVVLLQLSEEILPLEHHHQVQEYHLHHLPQTTGFLNPLEEVHHFQDQHLELGLVVMESLVLEEV